jgi:hypothetical protein
MKAITLYLGLDVHQDSIVRQTRRGSAHGFLFCIGWLGAIALNCLHSIWVFAEMFQSQSRQQNRHK